MVDLAWYKNSLKTCRNFLVKPYGGVVNRSGSQFIAEQKSHTTRTRLVPFSFSATQNYVIEFGVGYLRIFVNGTAGVLDYSPSAWNSGTYNAGDYAYSSSVTYYSLADGNTNHTPASSPTWWYPLVNNTPDGFVILEIPTSYTEAELRGLVFSQNADVLTITHNNHPPMLLSRYSATKWTFLPQQLDAGPFEDDNINNTVAVWVSATTGGGITISATKALFFAKHVGMLFKISQKDFGQSWLPGKAATLGDIARSGGNYYIALTTGTTGQNIPIGTGDHWNDGGVDWGYLHNGFGVARITAVAVGGLSCTADVLSRIPDGTTTTGYVSEVNLGAAAASGAYTKYTVAAHGLPAGFYGTALVNLTWIGWRVRGALGMSIGWNAVAIKYIDANTLEFALPWYSVNLGTDDLMGIVANKFKPPLNATTSASYKWAFGAFGDPALGDATNGYGPGYPAAVTYYQQRKVFGGTLQSPDGIWTSKTGSFNDFGQTNPVLDDDSVVYKLASSQVNPIRHLLQLDKLLVLTQGAVWATGTGNNTDVLTPGNIGVKLQSYQGVSTLPPIGIGGAALYVQHLGQVVRDMNYQWANDAYTGQNLTAKGSHLVEGHTMVEWAFQQAPLNVVWMVRDDGVLLGLTYLREQEVAAWHHHDTDGLYESVCCVTEGGEDVLYVTVKRTIGGATKRYIERFATRLVTDINDAFFVDSGVTYDNRNVGSNTITMSGGTLYDSTEEITLTASGATFVYPGTSDVGDQIVVTDVAGVAYQVTITSTFSTTVAKGRPVSTIPTALRTPGTAWSWARNTLPGLGHLEGKSVMVLADGNVAGPFTVVSGAVTLVTPAVKAHAGLAYTSDLETLPLAPSQQESLRGSFKLVNVLRAILLESRSIWAGPDETKLYESKTRAVAGAFQQPPNLTTGVVEIRLASTWNRNGTCFVRHTLPTPIGILALMPEVSVGGA